ncbi:uncharacterized protein LOC126372169 [Pectinophora gossypiella]|uniref:uncharacterized protein LOC126372169 n=1 Tax=Pectinophora gossypiella TaxID=13191 RepID=UPI00214E2912|nr:uncharacterized protein LOC126372169 [Pectinophora gossypiella]
MANQGIYFVPYPYPLVMTGVQSDNPSSDNTTTESDISVSTRRHRTLPPKNTTKVLKLLYLKEETESMDKTTTAINNTTGTTTRKTNSTTIITTTPKPKKKKKRIRPHDHHYHYEHYHDHYDRHHSHSHSHEHGKHHGRHNKNNTNIEKKSTTSPDKDKKSETTDSILEKKDIVPENKDGYWTLDSKDKNATSNVPNHDKSYDPIQKLLDSSDVKPNIEITKDVLKSPIDASALRDLLEAPADKSVHPAKPGVNDIIFKVPGKGSTKYILTSLRRVKQNWMPKYGIVPIPDTVASDLMTQLRSMKVLNPHQEQKSPPATKPTVLELANKLYRY